jgi:ribose transport system substrate-binding protein
MLAELSSRWAAGRRTVGATLALGALALVALAGCGSSGTSGSSSAGVSGSSSASASTSANSTGQPLSGKSVYVVECADVDPFCATYKSYMEKTLGGMGAKVTVLEDNFNPAQQAIHFNQAIAAKPSLITVLVDDVNGIIPSLLKAKQAGIPVINSVGRELPQAYALLSASVECDCQKLGQQAAENIVAGLKAEHRTSGNVVAITGTHTEFIAQDRVAAFEKAMARYPQYKVVAVKDGNWEAGLSAQIYSQLYARFQGQGGIAAAWGMNDDQTNAIIQAAQQVGQPVGVKHNGLIAVGTSCEPLTFKNLAAGLEYAGSTNSPLTEVEPLAKVVGEYLEGKSVPKITRANERVVNLQDEATVKPECSW